MPRKLRPRPAVATSPSHVSQLTVEAVAGIDPRRFLELLSAHPDVPRAAVGRLRVVALDDLRDLLERLATTVKDAGDDEGAGDDEDEDEDEPLTEEAILARLGMRRTG